MKYTVRIAGNTFEVNIEGREVTLDGRQLDARLLHQSAGMVQLQMEGVSRLMALVPGEHGWTVHHRGETQHAAVLDERARRAESLTATARPASRGEVVRAPMPGLVLRLEVGEGSRVEPGTGVLVLEAMKMENEIRASSGGVVTKVLVAVGSPVEKGAPLIEIEAPS